MVHWGRKCTGKHIDAGQTCMYIFFFTVASTVLEFLYLLSVSPSSMVCKEVQTAKARKLVLPILEAHQEDEKYSLIIHQTNTRKQKFYCNFTSFSLLWYIWQYNQNSRLWISLGGIQNIQFTSKYNPWVNITVRYNITCLKLENKIMIKHANMSFTGRGPDLENRIRNLNSKDAIHLDCWYTRYS